MNHAEKIDNKLLQTKSKEVRETDSVRIGKQGTKKFFLYYTEHITNLFFNLKTTSNANHVGIDILKEIGSVYTRKISQNRTELRAFDKDF